MPMGPTGETRMKCVCDSEIILLKSYPLGSLCRLAPFTAKNTPALAVVLTRESQLLVVRERTLGIMDGGERIDGSELGCAIPVLWLVHFLLVWQYAY